MLSWLIGDATDPEDAILCRLLSLILLGNEAAPLRKAIIDAKLGADLVYSGASSIGPAGTFYVGLKGSETDRADAFTQLVIDTLAQVADSEIDNEKIEAAFQQATYYYQEVAPMFPLRMLYRVIEPWIYEKRSDTFLKLGESLATVRQRWEKNPSVFNELIRERLVDNPHRLLSVLSPDQDMQAKMEAELVERMKETRAQLSDEQVREIAADAAELERLNGQPNPPEALAKLPQLQVNDLPEKPRHIPTVVEKVAGRDLLKNDVFANGVNYLVLNFDLQGLPEHLWTYLPRYADAISKLGAAGMNYAEIAQRTSGVTGGIGCAPGFTTHALDPNRPLLNLNFHLKALDEKIEAALDVLHDLVFDVDPRDTERLRDVVVQAVAEYRTEMIHDGSGTAIHHASRGLSVQAHLAEIVGGLPQLRSSETLLNSFDELNTDLMGHIEEIRDFLLTRGRVTASFTGSDTTFEQTRARLSGWLDKMRDEPVASEPIAFQPFETPPREGLAGPIQIAHCAHVIPAPHYSHPDSTLLSIGAHILRLDYIMSEIRFKGNAYGAYGLPIVRLMQMCIRLHIGIRTLHARLTSSHRLLITSNRWNGPRRTLTGRLSQQRKPLRNRFVPVKSASDALSQHLTGQTREMREERYAQLRQATPTEVKRALLELLEENRDKAAVCAVSSREKLEAANSELAQPLVIEDILT